MNTQQTTRYFYQYKADRLPFCLLTVHTWLHVVDYMELSGPVWVFWCFVMERYCGRLLRSVSSRKHPFASVVRRILELGALAAIRHRFDLQAALPTYSPLSLSITKPTKLPGYPTLHLLTPHCNLDLSSSMELKSLHDRIAVYFVTRWDKKGAKPFIKKHIPLTIEQYGRVQVIGHDTITACRAYSSDQTGRRDATFLQYEQLVDQYADDINRPAVMKPFTFYGQLQRVLVVTIQPAPGIPVKETSTFVLLDILPCATTEDRYGYQEYTTTRAMEIAEAMAIRALVGRIFDRGKWVIVKRPGISEHADYQDVDDDDAASDGYVSD